VGALLSAFALVFAAELGDKSMLLVLAVATRVRAPVLLAVIAISAALLMAVAVVLGAVADELLPRRPIEVGAALVFLAIGGWTLRASLVGGGEVAADVGSEHERSRRGVQALVAQAAAVESRRSMLLLAAAIGGALVIAELGDKTQLAVVSLAGVDAGEGALVWVGATAGMTAADAIAVLAGARLARTLPAHLIERVAAVLFVAAGLALLALAVL
jgi:putative Ca2+/H+ antiporter (TMEM165/GDT1 family)